MNTQNLIDGVFHQTTILIAHLATAGGTRVPLARIANKVFRDLAGELRRQGIRHNVIADMFGMALRSYHRRVRTVTESETEAGRTVWDAVLDYVHGQKSVSLHQVRDRFRYDEPNIVTGVLNDLVSSGFISRTGGREDAVFRAVDVEDFEQITGESRREAHEFLVWGAIYREGPLSRESLAAAVSLDDDLLDEILRILLDDGRIEEVSEDGETRYRSNRFEVLVGSEQGWEAAVLDHFQAMVSAICVKLRSARLRSAHTDVTGGATYTLDVWPEHPLDPEARGLLNEVRKRVDDLRDRIDAYNDRHGKPTCVEPVIFYAGQYLKSNEE